MQKIFDRNVCQNCTTTPENSVCSITERELIWQE